MIARIQRALPGLYFVWALPLLLTVAWLTPPWSNPDEPNQMLRITQLAQGHLIGERLGPSGSGGLSNKAILDAAAPLDGLRFHPERKVSLSMLAASERVPWDASPTIVGFPNTAPYPPFLYLPAIVAVWVGKLLHLYVDHTLYLARAATALAAVIASTAALALAQRTRYAIAVLAMLPMTCALSAAASQDALIIALTLLSVGWIDHLIESDRMPGWGELLGLATVLAAVGMARPPYVVFALLPLLATARLRLRSVVAAGVVVAAVGAWSLLAARTVLVSHGDPLVQLHLLLGHPWRIVTVLLTTLHRIGPAYAVEFIGQLGWLDTALPHWYINFAYVVLGISFIAAITGASRQPWLPLCIAVGGRCWCWASSTSAGRCPVQISWTACRGAISFRWRRSWSLLFRGLDASRCRCGPWRLGVSAFSQRQHRWSSFGLWWSGTTWVDSNARHIGRFNPAAQGAVL